MREYLTIFLVAMAVTYLLCVVAREIALRFGAVAKVRQRDMHEVPVPVLRWHRDVRRPRGGVPGGPHLPFLGSAEQQVFDDAGVVVAAGGLICLLGVVDDLLELDALIKLLGQILVAGFLVLNGVRMYLVPAPGR